jgi:CheY-like chemotaxis protein
LVIEDEAATQLVYEKFLKDTIFQMVSARTIWEAEQMLPQIQPKAIVLDILLPGENAWSWLLELKGSETTRHIPVLIVTSVDDRSKGLTLGADAYSLKPVKRQWLLEQLTRLTHPKPQPKLLVIDDEETGRYLLKKMLAEIPYHIDEAPNGQEGLRQAREKQPDVIFLDLIMPGLSGFEVLAQLKADPNTQAIPVIAVTSKMPTGKEEQQLAAQAQATLSKAVLSREMVLETVRKITDKAS